MARHCVTVSAETGKAEKLEVTDWWTERQAKWLGSGLGTFVGLMGAVVGVLTPLSQKPRYQNAMMVVRGIVWCGIGFGVIGLGGGTLAWLIGQPYHVYFIPLLIGGVCACVWPGSLYTLNRQRAADEMRRMSAQDTGF